MFKCLDCGFIFKELTYWEEPRGEYWGIPCSEQMCGCPNCYGEDIDDYNDEELEG